METRLFKTYQSITRATKVDTLIYFKNNGFGKTEQWYVTEKIHGCNIGFIVADLDFVKSSKDYIEHQANPEKSTFHIISVVDNIAFLHTQRNMITKSISNSHLDFDKVETKLRALQKEIGKPIHVYGEWYGGNVIQTPDSIPYFKTADKKEFIFFDIRFCETDDFVSYPKVFELFDKFELPRVTVLKTGTLDECLTHPLTFKSIVSDNNVDAEGYVLKPYEPAFIEKARVILKMIAPAFDDEKKGKVDLEIARQKQKDFDNFIKLESVIDEKINMVRLGKVAAKFNISNDKPELFGYLKKHFTEDIYEECTQQKIELTKNVKKSIENSAVVFIKEFFKTKL